DEIHEAGMPSNSIRTVSDPRTGLVTEVWVRWLPRPHLFFSRPQDRHYMVERGRGRLIFGNGKNGRLPPVGPNNIRAARYQTTDGSAGNVPTGKMNQVLGGARLAQT